MHRNHCREVLAILLFLLKNILTVASKESLHLHHRQARGLPLLFPPTAPTRTQWIVGIGIPVEDLLFEAITTGYVFKAEYALPETVEQLKTKSQLNLHNPGRAWTGGIPKFEQYLVSESELSGGDGSNATKIPGFLERNKRVLTSYRWSVYRSLEGLANKMGLAGRACVLKSICEAAEVQFHYANGMFGELFHLLLTPSSSADKLSEYADNEYFHAESMGRSGADCNHVFNNCRKSLLDHFTDIYTISGDMQRLLG